MRRPADTPRPMGERLSIDLLPASEGHTARGVTCHFLLLAFGYGMYRSLMNLSYSTAMATVPGTYPLGVGNLEFSLSVSASIMLCSALLAITSWVRPSLRIRGLGMAAIVVLAGINLCSGLGVFSSLPPETAALSLSFVYGMAAICANAAWLVPFSALGPRPCLTALAASVLVSALTALALGGLAVVAQCFLLAALGLASAACIAVAPHPGGACAETSPEPGHAACRTTCTLLAELWSPLVVYASFTMLTGFVTSFLSTGTELDGANPASNIAQLVGALLVAVIAFALNKTFDLRKTFQRAFPVVALLLVVLPFTGQVYGTVFYAALAFLNSIVNVSMLFLLVETSRVRNAPVVAVVCLTMFLTRLCLVLSLVVGKTLGTQGSFDNLVRTLVVVIAAIYLLSTAFVLIARKQDARVERVAVPLSSSQITFNTPNPALIPSDTTNEISGTEPVNEPQCSPSSPNESMKHRTETPDSRYRLTPREQEVVSLLARGRTAPYIAKELGLSTNTVRGYTQEAYAKLGIHSKQELIDLIADKEVGVSERDAHPRQN